MKKFVFFSTLSLTLAACQQQSENSTNNTSADSTQQTVSSARAEEKVDCSEFDKISEDLLADREPAKAKENAKYVQIAQKIWQHRSSERILEKELNWAKCTQQTLTEAFNTNFPNADKLGDAQKADSMANALYAFLTNKPEDYSTFGMVQAEELCSAFTRYKLATGYVEMLKMNGKMEAEIKSWMAFRDVLDEFMTSAIILENYGGSIVHSNLACYNSGMLDMRNRSVSNLVSGKNGSVATTVAAAKDELVNAMEKRCQHLASYDAESDDEKQYVKKMNDSKKAVLSQLDAWLKTREGLDVDANTVTVLKNLSKMNSFEE